MESSEIIDDMNQISTGEIDRLKQIGFYLDIDDDKIKRLPYEIGKSEASKWIERAGRLARLTEKYSTDSEGDRPFATAPFHEQLLKGFRIPF
jgi:hypothetical protein